MFPSPFLRFLATVYLPFLGPLASARAQEPVAAPAGQQHLLYVARAPKDVAGFRDLLPSIEIHDIADGHKLLRTLPLPKNVFNIRGICASAATGRLYVSHYGVFKGHVPPPEGAGLLCLDLVSGEVLWEKRFLPSVDRLAITPDGAKIYLPKGEHYLDKDWMVLDARTGDLLSRVEHVSATHNTICTLDGKRVFLQGFGQPSQEVRINRGPWVAGQAPVVDENPDDAFTHQNGFLSDNDRTVAVVDTATDKIIQRVGPFSERTRPITINGKGSLLFCSIHDLIGFEVADVLTGKLLFRAEPPAGEPVAGVPFTQIEPTVNYVFTHGIALTADERELWHVDIRGVGLHAYDVSGLPEKAPRWLAFVPTRTGRPELSAGYPSWICSTIDGRYFYPETGEIVDTKAKKVLGQLVGANGRPTHSRFMLEVVLRDGKAIAVGDQFGVGRVTK